MARSQKRLLPNYNFHQIAGGLDWAGKMARRFFQQSVRVSVEGVSDMGQY